MVGIKKQEQPVNTKCTAYQEDTESFYRETIQEDCTAECTRCGDTNSVTGTQTCYLNCNNSAVMSCDSCVIQCDTSGGCGPEA